MNKKMLINSMGPLEIRVALVENDRLEAFHVEAIMQEKTRGNIYKALVVGVEPRLQAVFLDYGVLRHGFLHIAEVRSDLYSSNKIFENNMPQIEEVFEIGQEILVQILKEESTTKGASLTTFFSIPGQNLVLTVGREGRGVSRKLDSEAERDRLKDILTETTLPSNMGLIARTASEGCSKRELQVNCKLLVKLWNDIKRRADKVNAPILVHHEEELVVRAVRDLLTSDISEVVVDNSEMFIQLRDFLAVINPRRKNILKLHREKKSIFNKYGIDGQLKSIYQPTVYLNSGGSVVIQSTEALVSIDVNSGRAVMGDDVDAIALTVNQEAAIEIARQLRLRDLGGLIVIDFMDMREQKYQTLMLKGFKKALKKDKAKITLGNISRFGLLELSRQQVRPPLDFGAIRVCPFCQGRGSVRTQEALAQSILSSIKRKIKYFEGGVCIHLSSEIAAYLLNTCRAELQELEAIRGGACLEIYPDPQLNQEDIYMEQIKRMSEVLYLEQVDKVPDEICIEQEEKFLGDIFLEQVKIERYPGQYPVLFETISFRSTKNIIEKKVKNSKKIYNII